MAERKIDLRLDEICTREDFLRTYPKQIYYAEKAAAFLDERGIFPLTYSNPQLVHLNTLGLYVYYSGSLLVAHPRAGARLARGRDHQHDLTAIWKRHLGLTFIDNDVALAFGQNGATYARLLSAMGFHTNDEPCSERPQRKARTGSQIPAYLRCIISTFDELGRDSRKNLRRYISDLVAVCFDTRASVRSNRGLRVDLLSQPTEELVIEEALQLVAAVNHLYPSVSLNPKDISVYSNQGKWQGYITLPFEKTLGFPQGSFSPVKVKVHVEPRFSFEHPTTKE